jgi:sec-independent protein translocase protein TatB
MSGIGFSELIILFLIGLIVLGPERLPRVANQLGGWLGQARRMTRVMKRQLEEELNLEKDLSINPNPTVHKPDFVTPANKTSDEVSDTYSPAHEAGDQGTGVGDDAPSDEAEAEKLADIQAMEDDIDSTISPPETETTEKDEKAT